MAAHVYQHARRRRLRLKLQASLLPLRCQAKGAQAAEECPDGVFTPARCGCQAAQYSGCVIITDTTAYDFSACTSWLTTFVFFFYATHSTADYGPASTTTTVDEAGPVYPLPE